MVVVIQRISRAAVYADGVLTGSAGAGLYLLCGVEDGDTEKDAVLLAEKIRKLRIFNDERGKMNRSLADIDGEVLVVSNFTLNAHYAHGNRPDYLASAKPEEATRLYLTFVDCLKQAGVRRVEAGVFGADMKTDLVTDGPVTIVMYSGTLGGNTAHVQER